MKITIVICEGPHDTAFLSRILKANGYKSFSKKLSEYPEMVTVFLTKQVRSESIESLNLDEIRSGQILPNYARNKEGHLILLFNVGGDGKEDKRRLIIDHFVNVRENPLARKSPNGDEFRMAYVYDADNKGVDIRLKEVEAELCRFTSKEAVVLEQGKWSDNTFGAYIFADDSGFGRLEDLILPLMKEGNDDVHNEVMGYLDKRNSFSISSSKDWDKDYDEGKSVVSVMGQLQKSGRPNGPIIEESAFITDDKIKSSKVCNSIFKFLDWK